MTLRAAAVMPPIRLFAEFTRIPRLPFGRASGSRRIGADVIALDRRCRRGRQADIAAEAESLIDQAADVALPPLMPEAGRRQAVAVQLDDRRRREARLRRAVDDHRLGDGRQRRQRRDRRARRRRGC